MSSIVVIHNQFTFIIIKKHMLICYYIDNVDDLIQSESLNISVGLLLFILINNVIRPSKLALTALSSYSRGSSCIVLSIPLYDYADVSKIVYCNAYWE